SYAERSPLADAIARRRTNREPFDASVLASEHARALSAEVTTPIRLRLVTDRERIAALARLVGIADRIRAENERAHTELHRWLRWTAVDAREKGDGLDVRTLGLRAHERAILRGLRSWSRARVANRIGWSKLAQDHGQRVVRSSSALGILTAPG